MSSPSKTFECRWQASRRLAVFSFGAHLCALVALLTAALPFWATVLGVALWAVHAGWAWRQRAAGFCAIRHDADGWYLGYSDGRWQSVQLRPDSLALPPLIVLRFRLPGQWWVRGLCIAADALPADSHRQLRVRLKFTRRRWAAPE
ncbi:protein YgfX [Pseudomonas sp. GV071]|uniref:protein YgfX n=1 Tax=Pseudomonas sp. GV071 TaxID=2135754 RepID=UPI000D3C821E|nr:protein YgfX [Pseudomonas sp. GV071]